MTQPPDPGGASIGGAEGGALLAKASDELTSLGAKNPARIADLVVPGIPA